MKKSMIAIMLGAGLMVAAVVPASAEDHGMHTSTPISSKLAVANQVKSDMKITLNGQSLALDESYLIDNSLFVPYRAFAEGIGAEVGYDADTRTVTVTKSGKTVKLSIGSAMANVDGTNVAMVGPAQLINSSTFVHSRFLAEVFGVNVQYDESTRTVNLVTGTGQSVAKTYYINIESFAFSNTDLTVEAGSTIVFTNKDSVKHNAVADDGSFKTPLLSKGESESITLTKPGEYSYFCEPHKEFMKGKITVK
ncbi:stalk domain-containing protein [Paenibacillus qinlingensis]|uniref:Plastocyanin n=1 Tax=Paenibacillus qinlingensis TaxID=1837343 RepID=A0ABU1NS03_9BACL|nr:stalk domain-containing protein [Paenibacillus qinlingensis]MDR6550198.1 plastocyanin [Paenibacillus qinlingensis]